MADCVDGEVKPYSLAHCLRLVKQNLKGVIVQVALLLFWVSLTGLFGVLASEGWWEASQPFFRGTFGGQRKGWKTLPQVSFGWTSLWNVIFYFSCCWLGDRNCVWPVKRWLFVCWWWRIDWSFALCMAPVASCEDWRCIVETAALQQSMLWKKVRPGPERSLKEESWGLLVGGIFAGRMPFPSPNQQCQSTEGIIKIAITVAVLVALNYCADVVLGSCPVHWLSWFYRKYYILLCNICALSGGDDCRLKSWDVRASVDRPVTTISR